MPSSTGADRGALLNVGTWLALIATGLIACAKLITKWATNRSLQADDAYTALALILAVAESVAVAMAVRSGLGQHNVAGEQLEGVLKGLYAAQILYVATVYVTKLGALQFLLKLARPGPKRTAVKIASALTGLWLVVAVLCLAIQCDMPHPWSALFDRCFNLLAFWTVNAVLDILSQLLIGLLPIYLLHQLQLSPRSKRVAMASFAPNLLTIPLTVLRLVFLFQLSRSADLSFDAFDATLVTDIHASISIITVCIPFLKPIVESLSLGIVTADMVTVSEPASTSVARAAASLRSFYGWVRLQGGDRQEEGTRVPDADTEEGSKRRRNQASTNLVSITARSPGA